MFHSVCVVSASVKTDLYFIPIKHEFHAKNSKKQNKMKIFPQKRKKNDSYKSVSDSVIGLVGASTLGTRRAACLCRSIPVAPPHCLQTILGGCFYPLISSLLLKCSSSLQRAKGCKFSPECEIQSYC